MSRIVATKRLAALVALVATSTAGCDGADPEDDVPVTSRALAVVAAEYTGTPDLATDDHIDWFDAFDDAAVAAELRYHQTKLDYGDSVTVTVGVLDRPELTDCDATVGLYTLNCEETPDGTLRWNLDDPEEDPGGVFVLVAKSDGRTALVTYAGPRLTADPRTVDLPVTVATLFDLAHDPRVDTTTSPSVVEQGEAISYWSETLTRPGE